MPSLPLVSATDPHAQKALDELNAQLQTYYNQPAMREYYARAHAGNQVWPPDSYHTVLRRVARPATAALDMGCGSGHACSNLQSTGVSYTGVDWSQEQIQANRNAYGPGPRFEVASLYHTQLPSAAYDMVFSLFVLEHMVWPHHLLDEMIRLTRPGGYLIILCPEFRSAGRIPSLDYGLPVLTLRDRLRRGHVLAAARHLYRRNVRYPRLIRRDFPPARAPFLINTQPSCLRGSFYPDIDAVYLVDRPEIVAYLARAGLQDQTAQAVSQARLPWPLIPGVCLVVAQRTV